MQNKIKKSLLVLAVACGLAGGLAVTSSAQAGYGCRWVSGHWNSWGYWVPGRKVCWGYGGYRCGWVKGHWSHGHWYNGHRVCR